MAYKQGELQYANKLTEPVDEPVHLACAEYSCMRRAKHTGLSVRSSARSCRET